MIHRPHFQTGLFQASKAGLDDPTSFVSKRHVRGSQCVIIGDHDELAVELLGRFDLGGVKLGPALLIGAEIPAVTPGCQERAGRLGMGRVPFRQQGEFRPQFGQNLRPVLALAGGFFQVQAQHIAPPPFAVADPNLLVSMPT